MRIGAHVSSAGGLSNAIDRGAEIGAETVQLFCSPPQGWAFKLPSEEQVIAFRQKSEETGIGPAFLHGIYLMNFGSPDPALVEKSIAALVNYMGCASQIGAQGVIFHCGSHKGAGYDAILKQTTDALAEVLKQAPSDTQLIIENTAGMGNHICASFAEIGGVMKGLASPQVKVCLDTEHAFAAGYDVSQKDALERAMEEFDKEVGLSNLAAVHANDAKVEFGSGVDRHENIGEGHIGIEGFEVIMGHPAFRDVPFLLEVPGTDKKGPDREQLDKVKEIRARAGAR
jgi:deoxyribonuclease-4